MWKHSEIMGIKWNFYGIFSEMRIMGYMNDIINTMVYIWVCLQVDEPIAIVVVIVIYIICVHFKLQFWSISHFRISPISSKTTRQFQMYNIFMRSLMNEYIG